MSTTSDPSVQNGPHRALVTDPWTDQRARYGLNTLVRVINLDEERQEFVLLNPKNADDLADLEFDGCTFVLPEKRRTPAELAEILARFDALYWTDPNNKQTRISALDRERYCHR
jgi:hypothetical protein